MTRFWAEHLEHFHGHPFPREPGAVEADGWHLHFVLPWELADKHDDDEYPHSVPESLRVESVQLVSTWSAIQRAEGDGDWVSLANPDWVAPACPRFSTPSRPVGTQVLLTYSERISWRALACVARC